MVADFEIRSSQSLAALGRRLAVAGDGKVKRDLLATIRASASEAIPGIRDSARQTLPHGGGLAEEVASLPYAVRTTLAASGGRVSIAGRGMKEIRDIDRGNLRHPVYGNRKVWRPQAVPPGFASTPITKQAPKILLKITAEMQKTAEEITRGGSA
jgi:hypothetical protein